MAVYTSSLSALEHLRAGKRGLARAQATAPAGRAEPCAAQENSAAAGAFTGVAVALLATRRAPVVAMSAALSAGLMVGVDASLQLVEAAGRHLAAADKGRAKAGK